MSLDIDVMNSFRDYLGFGPKDDDVVVYSTDATSIIKDKIQNVLAETVPDSPEGVGRIVVLPPGRLTTDSLVLSQAQTLRGVKGSTILTLAANAALADVGGSYGAYIKIKNDFKVIDGIAGQGVIEDLDVDLVHSDSATGVDAVHGLYAAPRNPGEPANLHTMRNVAVYKATGDGIHFEAGNDKLVCDRMRSEGAQERGMYLAGGDVKARALGSVSTLTALEVVSAAVEIDQFDLWRPDDANGTVPTLKITGGINGCVLKSGTIEGMAHFVGKNADAEFAENDFINSRAQFAFVHFKNKKFDSNPECHLQIEKADLVEIIACKFGRSGPDPKETDDDFPFKAYKYLIKILPDDDADTNGGLVKIVGASGLMRYLGRDSGAVNRMRIDAKVHICNLPKRLVFEWGRLGTVEMVHPFATDPTNPLRTHLRCDGQEGYETAIYPFGYLNVRAYFGDWAANLNDGISTFDMPDLPSLSDKCVPAIRFVP